MNDIVSIFPTADELRKTNVEQYSLYLFEQELSSIFRLIIWGKSKGFKKIQTDSLSKMADDFLVEKGYKISKEEDFYWIEWGE